MLDAGIVSICKLQDTSPPGSMPAMALKEYARMYFEERTVGITRAYLAKGVNQSIDLLRRIWYLGAVKIGDYAIINNEQYRIDNIQHLLDDNGLRVTDLTLSRLQTNYDFAITET